MKKKVVISILSVALIIALSVTVAAAVYISQQARMRLFSGKIEQPSNQPNDPKLILKVSDISVGQDGNVSVYDGATFPILTNVTGEPSTGLTNWTDENGKQPISAPKFVLSAENGEVQDVYYKIVVNGNTATSALRFGIDVRYYNEEEGCFVTRSGIKSIDFGSTTTSATMPELLGDGNVAVGENIEIYVSAWVDSYDLAEIGEYDNDSFSIDIVFFTQPQG